jgi:hypothetical protein
MILDDILGVCISTYNNLKTALLAGVLQERKWVRGVRRWGSVKPLRHQVSKRMVKWCFGRVRLRVRGTLPRVRWTHAKKLLSDVEIPSLSLLGGTI